MTLGIGGWIFHGQPMTLVRGLIRRGVRDLTLIPSPGSVAPDMLIGAGCVKTTGLRLHQLRAPGPRAQLPPRRAVGRGEGAGDGRTGHRRAACAPAPATCPTA